MTAILVDLDGTLCNTKHRDLMVRNVKDPDWVAYSLACHGDLPVWGVIQMVRRLYTDGARIILVSGRSELARERTVSWLTRFAVPYDELHMRKANDVRENVAFKLDVVRQITSRGQQIVLAVDDYPKVAAAFASISLPTVLVARNGVGR